MAYILGLIIVGIFFLALHYFTELAKTQKLTITAIFFILVAGAISYNAYSDVQTQKMLEVVTKYNQNKTISCDGMDINKSSYDLSIGTYTFIGKKNTPNYGNIISASKCK